MDLNHKYFKSISSSDNGEVNDETVFHYRQQGNLVWASYDGGPIRFGSLSGEIRDNKLFFVYRHQNLRGAHLTGRCESTPEIVDGLIRLHEKWEWTCGDYSKGESIIEEIPPPVDLDC